MEGHLRLCEVKGKRALFHGFFLHSRVVEPSPMMGGHTGGVVAHPLAIIEYENGVVTECYPYELKFLDKDKGKVEVKLPPVDLSGKGEGIWPKDTSSGKPS